MSCKKKKKQEKNHLDTYPMHMKGDKEKNILPPSPSLGFLEAARTNVDLQAMKIHAVLRLQHPMNVQEGSY